MKLCAAVPTCTKPKSAEEGCCNTQGTVLWWGGSRRAYMESLSANTPRVAFNAARDDYISLHSAATGKEDFASALMKLLTVPRTESHD